MSGSLKSLIAKVLSGPGRHRPAADGRARYREDRGAAVRVGWLPSLEQDCTRPAGNAPLSLSRAGVQEDRPPAQASSAINPPAAPGPRNKGRRAGVSSGAGSRSPSKQINLADRVDRGPI